MYFAASFAILIFASLASSSLKEKGIKVGIITDGRPNGQRAKILALGLLSLVDDVIITDELGGEQFRKPCDIAFRIMQRKWQIPFGEMIYVGDNPAKDFAAPRQLGMKSLQFYCENGLYSKKADCPSDFDGVSKHLFAMIK